MEEAIQDGLLAALAIADRELASVAEAGMNQLGLGVVDLETGGPPPPATALVIAEFASAPWEIRVRDLGAGGVPLPHLLLLRPRELTALVDLLRAPNVIRRAVHAIIDIGPGLEGRLASAAQPIVAPLVSAGRIHAIRTVLAGNDPILADFVLTVMRDPIRHTTLRRTETDVSVSGRSLRRAMARQGFRLPSRYLRCVRVFGAHALLRSGASVARAARAMGYGSPDTLRDHFKSILRMTPSQARALSVEDLAGQLDRSA